MMRGFTSRLVILKHCEGRTRVIPIRRLLRVQKANRGKVYTAKVDKNHILAQATTVIVETVIVESTVLVEQKPLTTKQSNI